MEKSMKSMIRLLVSTCIKLLDTVWTKTSVLQAWVYFLNVGSLLYLGFRRDCLDLETGNMFGDA